MGECCGTRAFAWTWRAPDGEPASVELRETRSHVAQPVIGARSEFAFRNSPFHVAASHDFKVFPPRELHYLNGVLNRLGGIIALHDANGTILDTVINFSLIVEFVPGYYGRNLTMALNLSGGGAPCSFNGQAFFKDTHAGLVATTIIYNGDPGTECYSDGESTYLKSGPSPPSKGTCTTYSSIRKVGLASKRSVSGGPGISPKSYKLYPSWPASSPWVTAVGGTRFVGETAYGEEMATTSFGSGGGFSMLFNQTDAPWQADLVAAYVKLGPTLPKFPASASFNAFGRATPDVAALGEGFQVYVNGTVRSIGGTSASAPSFAGMVALLNEARFKAKKPPMGFLNPFLYSRPDMFCDVVKGDNAMSRSFVGSYNTPVGYAAAPGWDASTGLGTPHFDKMLAEAMQVAPAEEATTLTVIV